MKLQYKATAVNGTLKITNKQGLVKDLQSLEGTDLILTLEKQKKSRSNQQNRFMWGVIVPIIRQGLIEVGYPRYEVTTEFVHDYLKENFCPKKEIINEDTGEIITAPPSTANLSTVEFMEYFEDIQRWSAEFLNVVIPDPNTQVDLELNFNK